MSKKTAVEWLDQEIINFYGSVSIYKTKEEIIEQAKEMEKEQHWATWANGVANAENEKLFKDYYNETYNK
jgi:hypothetical protein